MLRDLVAAAGVDVSDAALLRVYLVCKECAKLERAQVCSASPASAAAEHVLLRVSLRHRHQRFSFQP
jgi:hypothetical protein